MIIIYGMDWKGWSPVKKYKVLFPEYDEGSDANIFYLFSSILIHFTQINLLFSIVIHFQVEVTSGEKSGSVS